MPLKQKITKKHHTTHKKEKRTNRFLKVYAPYIPLLLIVTTGLGLSMHPSVHQSGVKSYATNTSPDGLLQETNKRRLENGLPELTVNLKLTQAAQTKAIDMKTRNYWAHTNPDGKEPWYFIQNANYKYQKAAENLAYGFETSNTTLNGWMNSPGHRANVLDPDLKEVGFGIANVEDYQNNGPETIVVAMYGSALGAGTAVPIPANTAPVEAPLNQPERISLIQSITNGKAAWSGFAIGAVIGSIVMYLLITHARGLRRALRKSERFVVHHPLFDITLIALAALAVIANQTIGQIY